MISPGFSLEVDSSEESRIRKFPYAPPIWVVFASPAATLLKLTRKGSCRIGH
jgi:hypothetical protein